MMIKDCFRYSLKMEDQKVTNSLESMINKVPKFSTKMVRSF